MHASKNSLNSNTGFMRNCYPTTNLKNKAYIPLRRKKVAMGPPTPLFCVGDTNMSPTLKRKICVSPDANPNASQWNIGCVGSLALGLCVGHLHFIFFVLISFVLGSRRKRSFQWNMGLIDAKIVHSL